MSIDRFYSSPLVYRNRKYVPTRFPNIEYYPIRMYDSEYVCCIRVSNETNTEYPHVEYVEKNIDYISNFTIAKRIDKQAIFEHPTIEETSFGTPFVVEGVSEYIYLSIGDNFAIAFDYDARVPPFPIHIPSDIHHMMYVVEHEIVISIFKLFLDRLKKKDSFLEKVRTCLSSSNVYFYCDNLISARKHYHFELDISNYYIRRALEKILVHFLDSQWS